MKKVFTLMLSAILFTSAFAQYDPGYKNERGYDKKNDHGAWNDRDNRNNDRDKNYSFHKREMLINQINREYDQKIDVVKSKYYMSRARRSRWIASLENERREEIRKIYMRSNGWNQHY